MLRANTPGTYYSNSASWKWDGHAGMISTSAHFHSHSLSLSHPPLHPTSGAHSAVLPAKTMCMAFFSSHVLTLLCTRRTSMLASSQEPLFRSAGLADLAALLAASSRWRASQTQPPASSTSSPARLNTAANRLLIHSGRTRGAARTLPERIVPLPGLLQLQSVGLSLTHPSAHLRNQHQRHGVHTNRGGYGTASAVGRIQVSWDSLIITK